MSSVRAFWFHDQREAIVHAQSRARAGDGRGLTLLDDGGTLKGCARLEGVAVIDRRVDIAARLREIGLARRLRRERDARWRRAALGARDRDLGHRTGDHDAEV